jgi:Uma2 family endonuclease
MQATEQRHYTPEEYLELETTADYKSEYIDGQIIPMAGASTNHNQISLNLSSELNFAFKQQAYRVYMGDVRLWIPQRQIYTYPDVMVIKKEPEYFQNRTDTILNPVVIVEVLSKGTKNYDQESKFDAYRTIPSFQEYLLIDQTQIHVKQFSKTGLKQWTFCEYDASDTAIALTKVSFKISLTDLYNKVQLNAEANPSKTQAGF